MRHWPQRLALLWKFIRLIPEARGLEIDLQKVQQKLYDAAFENDLRNNTEEIKVAYLKGFNDGVDWCLKRL